MTTLVLIRHGESVYNAQGRVQGQTCAGLTSLGHEQAMATASWASQQGWPDVRIFTSDLQRARETSSYLESALGSAPVIDPGLRERSCGRWEGAYPDDLAASEPQRWARWRAHEDVLGEVGGESEPELTQRAVLTFRRLLGQLAEDQVGIAVTHGGPCWYGVPALLGLERELLVSPGNAAIVTLANKRGRLRLAAWNERGHLLNVAAG